MNADAACCNRVNHTQFGLRVDGGPTTPENISEGWFAADDASGSGAPGGVV